MDSMFERNKAFYSDEEQRALKNGVVLQVGVGGIGGVTSELLVRSGLGTLILVDGDRFEVTNLNRQIGATQETLGEFKAIAMAKRLKTINPDANVVVVNEYLTEDWGEVIPTTEINISSVDLIIDGVDGMVEKTIVSNYAKKFKKTLVAGGINMYNYWVAVFDGTKGVRDLFPNPNYSKASVNQCILFMCSSMMAMFACNFLTKKLRGRNFAFRYKNSAKEITRMRV